MKQNKTTIKPGIYLVVDPSLDEQALLDKLETSLRKGISIVQIWDHFKTGQKIEELIRKIYTLCARHKTPVLINNRWEYLESTELDGVHFDAVPENFDVIRKTANEDAVFGLTCENDLDKVRWAAQNDMDYISFCSMFPSESASGCEIVNHETVKQASMIFDKPLFLAGGIYPDNLHQLDELKYYGIAVISGIMESDHPDRAISEYQKNLHSTT